MSKIKQLFESGEIKVSEILDQNNISKSITDKSKGKERSIRSFLLPEDKQSCDLVEKIKLNQCKKASQANQIKAQPKKKKIGHRSVNAITRESLKQKAKQTRRRVTRQNKQSDMSTDELSVNDSVNSEMSDMNSEVSELQRNTSHLDMSDQHQSEEEMLQYLACTMKHVTAEQIKESCQQRMPKRVRSESDSCIHAKTPEMEEPKSISYATVIEMFQEIKKEMTKDMQDLKSQININRQEDKKDLQVFKTDVVSGAVDVVSSAVSQAVELETQDIKKIRNELAVYKYRTKILADVCERFHTEISDLNQRMDNVELANYKKSVIITGHTFQGKKIDMLSQIERFFDEVIGVQVIVEDAFTLGNNDPKPTVVTFQFLQEKHLVMRCKNILKNYQAGKIFISDYIPANTQEKRRREKEIIQEIEKNEEIDSTQVGYIRGKLTIQGQRYTPKVSPPTPKELINMDVRDLERIQKLKMNKGIEYSSDGSRFVGYSAHVSSFQQIREFYIKAKILQPDARHIVCAYRLPGSETHYNQSFHDDGESGSGRVILEMLKDFGKQNIVVLVARKYGGLRMDPIDSNST